MFLFNLGLGEFLALFAGVSGVVAALYLLDRSRQKHRVATLRFWVHADAPSEMQHRRKIRQPWSLLLQIVSLLCLLLAIAQLRWGSSVALTRDHVLILDTSAVMNAGTEGARWIDRSRAAAKAWLAAVPKGDRVMLVRADALPTAATAFESKLSVIEEAIAGSRPTSSALRLADAVRFAERAQAAGGRRRGEIVYVGAGRSIDDNLANTAATPNLRVLLAKAELANVGFRKVGLRRNEGGDRAWEAYFTVRNDGPRPRTVPFVLLFGGGLMGQRTLALPPKSERSFTQTIRTEAAGILDARLTANDSFPDDDRAAIELPSQNRLKVAVFSDEPGLLKPLFSAHPRFEAVYAPASQYNPAVEAALVVLDRVPAAAPPRAPALILDPPKGGPVSVTGVKRDASVDVWHNENPLGAGLRSRDVKLESVSVFETKPGDLVVAEAGGAPAVVARTSPRLVAIGFHPLRSALKYELVAPLLFANALSWLAPEAFLRWELNAGAPGDVTVTLDEEPKPGAVTAKLDGGGAVPFSVDGKTLRFFSAAPGVVRVNDGRRERVFSLTLPDVASNDWQVPDTVRQGVPRSLEAPTVARDLWQWLAVLGGAGLLAEWLLFGRARRLFLARNSSPAPAWRKAS